MLKISGYQFLPEIFYFINEGLKVEAFGDFVCLVLRKQFLSNIFHIWLIKYFFLENKFLLRKGPME